MLSLDEYYKIAERTIKYFSTASITKRMLSDVDAVSFVVEKMINAEFSYDPSRNCTLRSWRLIQGKYAIRNYLKRKRDSHLSLYDEDENGVPIIDKYYNKGVMVDEARNLKNQQKVDFLINNSGLTSDEKKAIIYRFMDGSSYKDIADQMVLSKARAQQIVEKALDKMYYVGSRNA